MKTPARLQDVTGFRGEKIVELCLTEYSAFAQPLFRPGFLGDKWPAIDFYVELTSVPGRRPYFFAQCRTTSLPITRGATSLSVSCTRSNLQRLLEIPGPTYLLGIHEPSRRVFARSVHLGASLTNPSRIPISHELTPARLRELYNEVRGYWQSTGHKPTHSVFA